MNKAEIMTKKHDKKCSLVPRLRFPEFRDAGGWEKNKIHKISKIYKGKGISKADLSSCGKQLCIRYGELYTIYGEIITEVISKTTLSVDNLFLSKINDVIIPSSGETKIDIARSSCVLKDNIALGGDLNIIRSSQNGIFISYYLNGNLKENIAKIAQGDTIVHLYPIQIEQLDIAIPSKLEQQRIADCLSSLDERIAAETSKLDQLKEHKKGLLKQLFPAEGETLPQLRFPEFRDAGEWENIQLGPQTTKVGSGVTPRGGDRNYIKQGRPFIRSQNVGWGELILDDIVFISEEIHRTFISTEIEKNDILLNITGASIGRSAFADSRIAGGNVNQHVCIIRTKPSLLNSLFLMQYILSEYGQKQVDSFQAGGNRQGLNFAQVKSFSIPTPPQSTVMQCVCLEQQRIADCLSSLDELIAAQTQKIDLLKDHKKGLMQQLFPRIDEVRA